MVRQLSRRLQRSMPPACLDYLYNLIHWQQQEAVIKEVPQDQWHTIKACCPIFVIKQGSDYRLIHDLRVLNDSLPKPPSFRMEGWKEVAQLLKAGYFLGKLDHKKGYWQVPVTRTSSYQYLCFVYAGKVYRWLVLPFGLAWAPWLFTKMMRPLIQALRAAGVLCVIYLDDLLILGKTASEVQRGIQLAVALYEQLGWRLNTEKSILVPTQQLTYLGFELSTTTGPLPTVTLPANKQANIRYLAKRLIRDKHVHHNTLASWIGKAMATVRAVLPAYNSLQQLINALNTGQRLICLSSSAKAELGWWLVALAHGNVLSRPVTHPSQTTVVLTVDASMEFGWGGFVSLPESPDTPFAVAQGRWPQLDWPANNNLAECRGALQAVRHLQEHLRGQFVRTRTDNTTALAMVKKVGSRLGDYNTIARQLFDTLHRSNAVVVHAVHLPGIDNQIADALSRAWSETRKSIEWPMCRRFAQELQDLFDMQVNVDRFATEGNAVTARYNSYSYEPAAEALDGMAQFWGNPSDVNWVNPPFHMMADVVIKVLNERAKAIVIAPAWPGQLWYKWLVKAATASCLVPKEAILFGPGTACPEPLKNVKWSIRAFKLGY